ncbi:Protein LURP-one-related 15 [Vigna angularis]|uniref:Protein LURP-one-related 15 n=1 Tax=Phaseolus angularis TaxID=3914 RepID=A0A8T0KX76_PHAAN|nr:protein LURP-one-related 15 [Vigna angularis]KAG2404557.1 Protein LURP-one-related 15 [Vigna angularis]
MAEKISVINPSYCVPHSVSIQINTEKGIAYSEKDDRLFYIKDISFSLRDRRVLCDDTQKPIVTFYNKIMTVREQWKVLKGESNDSSDLVFWVKEVKKSSTIPSEITKLNVFLAGNKEEKKSDFRVIIYGSKHSCTVYAGESPTIIAKMENNGGFNVLVYPNVDYAFIVALLMIVKDVYYSNESKGSGQSNSAAIKMISTSLSLDSHD